jgi:alcohol dehydrogenase YqhD (iron-dependent ADH family)
MGENGILKIGKVTDFQAHMLEHQLGAYTDCNHGQGLASFTPSSTAICFLKPHRSLPASP